MLQIINYMHVHSVPHGSTGRTIDRQWRLTCFKVLTPIASMKPTGAQSSISVCILHWEQDTSPMWSTLCILCTVHICYAVQWRAACVWCVHKIGLHTLKDYSKHPLHHSDELFLVTETCSKMAILIHSVSPDRYILFVQLVTLCTCTYSVM